MGGGASRGAGPDRFYRPGARKVVSESYTRQRRHKAPPRRIVCGFTRPFGKVERLERLPGKQSFAQRRQGAKKNAKKSLIFLAFFFAPWRVLLYWLKTNSLVLISAQRMFS